ncbi:hypothetical protein [Sporisorium scitamineum]|uniref:Uncharacterized protein n=1 Tax=Sporisorium scitamineum TaxID=49012 RepID=A0A0F7S6U1_9BASI|nr:hypothetical protein [Sporisorium scitamineum]
MHNDLAGICQFMDAMVSTQLLLTPPKDTAGTSTVLQEQFEDSLEGGSELEQGTRVDMWLHSK